LEQENMTMKYAVLAVAVLGLLAGSPVRAESNDLAAAETPQKARVVHGGSVAVDTGSDGFPLPGKIFAQTRSHLPVSDTGSDSMPAFAGAGFAYGSPATALAGVGENPDG
jgi:hypothetical protein